MNLKTIKDRIVAILDDKHSGISPEVQNKVAEIIKRIEDLLSSNNGECDIPEDLIKEIARCLVPDIIAFFETEEAKREFEAWKLEQEKKNSNKAKNKASSYARNGFESVHGTNKKDRRSLRSACLFCW